MKLEYKGVNRRGRVEWEDTEHGFLLEEWELKHYRRLMETVESCTGGPLGEDEAKFVRWIAGTDTYTVEKFLRIVEAAHSFGKIK